MKARVLGFEWRDEGGIPLKVVLSWFAENSGEDHYLKPYKRKIFLEENDDAWVGLVLSVKDQKRFAELTDNGGKLKLSVREVEEGKSSVDFNFFYVKKATQRGVYLHYHQSLGINQFNFLVDKKYREIRDDKKDVAIAALGSDASYKSKQRARAPYKGRLELDLMVRPESVSDLLSEMSRVTSFEIQVSTLAVSQASFSPITELARKKILRYTFAKRQPAGPVVEAIRQAISSKIVKRGRVAGRDSSDRPWSFDISENVHSFKEYEYDDIAGDLEFDLSSEKLVDSKVIKDLEGVVNKKANRAFFEVQV